MKLLYLIPLFPLLGFLFNFTIGVRLLGRGANARAGHDDHGHGGGPAHGPSPIIGLVAAGSVFLSFLVAVYAVVQAHAAPDHVLVETLWTWLPGGAAETAVHGAAGATPFTVEWAYLLDPLSSVMVLVVTFVGFLIHVYSIGYMGHDPGYARYMSYLNLFMFAMLTLVLGANYAVLFVGWEGVGLCSYLLIGFWFHKQSASDAGMKAFIVNRIGDAGFLAGMFLVFTTFGTLDFRGVMAAAGEMPVEAAWGGTLTRHRALPLHRRDRQERADPALRLAARRDGRPDAGVRPHPRGDDGDRGRLHGRALGADLRARPERDDDRRDRRRRDRDLRGVDRPRPERHQARARLLDGEPARLHVPRLRRRRLHRRRLPPRDARLLQGAPLPRLGLGHPRDVGRAGHAEHGRPQVEAAVDARDDARRLHRDRRDPAARRLLLEGRDPLVGVQGRRLRPGRVDDRRRRRGADRLLHVPPLLDDVRRDVPRHRRPGAPPPRVAEDDDRAAADPRGRLDPRRLPRRAGRRSAAATSSSTGSSPPSSTRTTRSARCSRPRSPATAPSSGSWASRS